MELIWFERLVWYVGSLIAIGVGFAKLYNFLSRPKIYLKGMAPEVTKWGKTTDGKQTYYVHYEYQLINKGKDTPLRLIMKIGIADYYLSDYETVTKNNSTIIKGSVQINPEVSDAKDFDFPLKFIIFAENIEHKRLVFQDYEIHKDLNVHQYPDRKRVGI